MRIKIYSITVQVGKGTHRESVIFLMPTLTVTFFFFFKFKEDCKSSEILLKGWTIEVSTYRGGI